MISSSFVLAGPPKPAFFDGLLQQSSAPQALPATVDGWRDVAADGVNLLPTEAFVACNRFFVTEASSAAFEKRWADRESKLMTCDGFVSFSMLRRDVKAKGHGVTPLQEGEASYQSTTVWRDRAAFEAWRRGNAFKQAHAGSKPASASSSGTDGRSGGGGGGGPPTPLWSRPPQPVFYEATLVISSPEGA
jgi:heme-degrading monooxygenase HmoA